MAWQKTRIGDVVDILDRWESVVPTKRYSLLGMRSKIGGPFLRETKLGSEVSAKSLNKVQSGDFIYSRLFAWQGSFGLVPPDLSDCYVSNEFPIFRIDRNRIDPNFLTYWFGLVSTQKEIERNCYGSTPGTRNRFKEEFFYQLTIPLPQLEEQQSIARRVGTINAMLQGRLSVLDEVGRDTDAMLQNTFNEIIADAPYRSLAEVAPLVRRPVEVVLDGDYPELGIRSFGKGTFHKPTLTGADVGNKRLFEIHEGDLLFNIVFAWEGAIAVALADDHCRVGSHRFLTCVPHPDIATAEFLRFYLLSAEGLHKIGEASPGGAGRNRTLGIKKAEQIAVPIPSIDAQRRFDKLCAYVAEIRSIRASTAKDAKALIPAMLHEIFEEKNQALAATIATFVQNGNVVSLPTAQSTAINSPFKEAVLVGAIVKTFHEDGGQPLGNFRLQKAVYFARRFMGERALDQEYFRKAAGPYNPTMRYSGGVKIAHDKNWIVSATGKYGPGHSTGSAIDDANDWIEKYDFAKPAAWVRDKFKFKSNALWELLATVDYAMLALEHDCRSPSATNVFAYIRDDAEWQPKIEKLNLSEASIQNAMVELENLFGQGAA